MNQLLICLKKWRLWLTLLLTLFSIFLSIIAIYLSMRSPIEIDFDAALLVSVATIISIPTAVLIGWQIVNVIKIFIASTVGGAIWCLCDIIASHFRDIPTDD